MTVDPATVAVLAAAAAHLGFQTTVTVLVYPALARAAGDRVGWPGAHQRHSRGIGPIVAVLYGALAATGLWALLSDASFWLWVSAAGAALAFVVTAFYAAPTHGRLGRDPTEAQIAFLLRVDRIRVLGAAICLAGALLAVWR